MPSYNPKSRFQPRPFVRSFRDLEVYQKALEAAVLVAKHIYPVVVAPKKQSRKRPRGTSLVTTPFLFSEEMLKVSLEIPRLIAGAHSRRFDNPKEAVQMLEHAKHWCNAMIVHLEEVRDIYPEEISADLCNDLVRRYGYLRTKIFNLAKAWQGWKK